MTDEIYLNMATELAKMSHCRSIHVGALIVTDGRILATGINGSPRKYINCDTKFGIDFDRTLHHEWSLIHEIHAEMNAILFAAKHGIQINKATLYTTLHPCMNCIKHIIQVGIPLVIYRNAYDYNPVDSVFADFIHDNGLTILKERV